MAKTRCFARLAVDQDGAVVMATLDGEVVNAEHRDVTDERVGQRPNQPKESIATGRHAQRRGHSDTRLPGPRLAGEPGRGHAALNDPSRSNNVTRSSIVSRRR
ncbi:hypothetical protein [Actinoplanes sp. NPDC020271]|uniref:hypothetical protein n=1 Tax=Actinoplanes sp. NPDC020271 TaxID=3363896 RepID=UPI0037ADCBD3